MLQFDRHALQSPRLVVLEGGRREASGHARARRAGLSWPVLLVVLATLVAVLVDLVDPIPVWSHFAVLGTAAVLATHAFVTHRRR
ncbi:MAG TPA: hypothetical protein VF183_09465 [Acidimicrobiales bacterium]